MNIKKKTTILSLTLVVIIMAVFGYLSVTTKKIFGSRTSQILVTQLTDESQQQNFAPAADSELANQDSTQQGAVVNDAHLDASQLITESKNSSKSQEKTVKTNIADNAKMNTTDQKTSSDQSSVGKIVDKFVTWGFQKSSDRKIDAIIIHTSYNALGGDPFDFSKVMQEWKDAGVSPHYVIDRDGTIYHLVADQNIAWHAGSSKLPDGTTDVNGVSIGVEIINSQDSKFTDQQYSALNSLIATLKKEYGIKYILGHSDIAPGRKSDPWGIDWTRIQK